MTGHWRREQGPSGPWTQICNSAALAAGLSFLASQVQLASHDVRVRANTSAPSVLYQGTASVPQRPKQRLGL
jgi:hypothetical protein